MKILLQGEQDSLGLLLFGWRLSGTTRLLMLMRRHIQLVWKTYKSFGNPNYFFEHADIRNRNALDAIFENFKPDAVMHLAAESHVDRSIDGPADFIETNVNGTFNMLEAARSYWQASGKPKTFRFLHISTDEVFGSLPNDPAVQFTEQTPYDPRSPYSASKASSDHLVRAWHETYGLPVVLTNCSNNYGPYHFPEKLVPVIMNASINHCQFTEMEATFVIGYM